FTYYCAWFCPPEKGTFDYRLTSPVEVVADYARLRRAVTALAGPPPGGEGERPEPPDELLRKRDFTHLVVAGRPALEDGLARALFADAWRWPALAVEGRGVIVWSDPTRSGAVPNELLRLDPVRLAVGAGTVKLPAPDKFPPPPEPSPWQRYRAG